MSILQNILPEKIPPELRNGQSVLWKTISRNGHPTKVPYQPNGMEAKNNDPKTWSPFADVWKRYEQGGFDGVGFVFSHYDPFVGIDLDGCRDPQTGEIAAWAQEVIQRLDTYAEVSPSGSGIKCFIKGKSPFDTGKKKDLDYPAMGGKNAGIEIYSHTRYFALTGWRLDGLPETPQERDIQWLRPKFWPTPQQQQQPRQAQSQSQANYPSANVFDRARAYVAAMPPAISGQGGHNQTFAVACALIIGFDLDEENAFVLLSEYNERCDPPWMEQELWHKIKDATKQTGERGHLRDAPRDGGNAPQIGSPFADKSKKRLINAATRFIKDKIKSGGISGDGRNAMVLLYARNLAGFVVEDSGLYLSEPEIVDQLKPWNDLNTPPLSDDELLQIVRTALNSESKVEHIVKAIKPKKSKAVFYGSFPLTDSGNAERMAALFGDKFRYCRPWNKFLRWDGRRWNMDDLGSVEQMSKLTARSILEEAARIEDREMREAYIKFARKSESAGNRAAMIKLVQSEKGIPVLPDVLDKNSWLINCENGTVDLRTGNLLPHNKADMMTKLAPVVYDPDAAMPRTQKFFDEIFSGDQELIQFVQRFLGYCLSGEVSEQMFTMWHGRGANGKSTLLNAVFDVLGGDYSMKAGADMLLTKFGETHPTALTDLHGKRLVAAIETDDGRRLAESLVKELTGGDRIRARRMREDFWEFEPSHKIILACNHKPTVRGTDHAMWRRIKLVPFNVIFPVGQRDKNLPDKLKTERCGFFAWLVRGCLDWQRHGLGEPKAVIVATSNYAAQEDVLGEFIATCCVQGDAVVRAADLVETYRQWSGDRRMTTRKMTRILRELGTETYTNNGVWIRGLGLQANGMNGDLRNEERDFPVN